MKECAFTIVAKNYIGLAKVLEYSFKTHNPTVDFFIIVADELDDINIVDSNILEAKSILDIDEIKWNELSFKYNLTEFCTAIKPKSFEYLFKKRGYSKVIYLDPDIYCFASLVSVYNSLDKNSIVVTPHFLTLPTKEYLGDLPENIFLGMGIFNLGFLALKKCDSVYLMLAWWDRVLSNECYIDKERYTATDQKWMNYLPMFFSSDELLILRNLGLNAAPWNFFERKFHKNDEGKIMVSSRLFPQLPEEALVFVHFSNYNYSELTRGIINHYALKYDYDDLSLIFEEYVSVLAKSDLNKYIHLPYSYNTFTNGVPISLYNRRLYRRLLQENMLKENPFLSEGEFYQELKQKRLLTKIKPITTQVRGIKNKENRTKEKHSLDRYLRWLKKIIGIDRFITLSSYLSKKLLFENEAFLYDKKISELMKLD